ncbi:MAG: hypothetical protein HY703_12840 [Gemmatimonadetes bacterium]|nr:hypothetical protein [Gemmatimonadota bacterium]
MDDLFAILIFVFIFVIGPLLQSRARKKKSRAQPPQRPRTIERAPGPRPAEWEADEADAETPGWVPAPAAPGPSPETARPYGRAARGGQPPPAAADMIPDELWELLTGERRRPTPAPTPTGPGRLESAESPEEAEAEEWGIDAEEVPAGEEVAEEVLREEAQSLEEIPAPAQPVIVSLEELAPPAQRHAAFHSRLDQSAPLTLAPRPRPSARRRILRSGGRDDLRRAILLREVLGPPKALE